MSSRALRSALVAGVALAGLAMSAPAMATQPLSDLTVLESINGGSGQYTVVDNSAFWYVYGFQVTNPDANFAEAYTSRPNWTAGSCGSGCGNNPAFSYFNAGGPFDFANDIQPGETDGRFGFNASPASTYTLYLVNSDFHTTTVSGTAGTGGVPEPSTWGLMIAGLGLTGAALRRRRLQPVVQGA